MWPDGSHRLDTRDEWHRRKDNLLLANLLGQTHAYNIDPNFPHSVGGCL
jgi:hypothetical protein